MRVFSKIALGIFVITAVTHNPIVFAVNNDDYRSLIYDSLYYEKGEFCGTAGAVGDGSDELEGHVLPASEGGSGFEEYFDDNNVYGLVPPAIASQAEEDWYIDMRWRFVKWYWDGNVTSEGASEAGEVGWYATSPHRKILVTNPRTNKSVVTSAIESGPAPWAGVHNDSSTPPSYWQGAIEGTPAEYRGRVSGLAPKVMEALEVEPRIYETQGDDLLYAWADQSAPLGPTDSTATGGDDSGCADVVGDCGPMAVPLPEDITPSWFNYHAHGTSISYPTVTDGHNTVVHKGNDFGAESVANSDSTVGEASDIGIPAGTPVYAPFDGTVLYASYIHAGGADGNMVIIESSNKACVATLAHTTSLTVSVGETVAAGDEIGKIISLSASHLHFELWVNGEPINIGGPHPYVPFDTHAKEIWEKQKSFLLTGGL